MLAKVNSRLPVFFDDFLTRDFQPAYYGNNSFRKQPAVNIAEGDNEFTIEVAAPGLDKKDFNINLENDCLTISSVNEEQREEKVTNYSRREFNYNSFSRSFTLPDTANGDKIKASHKDGILYVNIPKKEEAKARPARQIAIS